jgi:hypothetical protein
MAIRPIDRFPLKVNGTSPQWPHGEPKDIAAPGDGTGTPWEVGVVKDIMGLQQALLDRAGITPSGNPENAEESQYLSAMDSLFGRTLPSTTSINTSDLTGVSGLTTLGYDAAGDGGGVQWAATGNTGTGGSTNFPQGLTYDSEGNEFAIVSASIDPRVYGAVGDGAADDTTPIQNAIDTQNNRGGGDVSISSGEYRCTAQLTIYDRVTLTGVGISSTCLNFNGAGGSFPDGFCIYGEGGQFTLPSLSVPAAAGTSVISFSAAHTRDVGDLVQFNDLRNFSFSPANSGYRAGEFGIVLRVISSTQLELEVPLVATTNPAVVLGGPVYETTSAKVFGISGIRTAIRGLEIRGIGSSSPGTGVVKILRGRNCKYSNLSIRDSPHSLLFLERCYDQVAERLELFDDQTGTENSGLRLSGCQLIWLNSVHGNTGRSVIEGRSTGDVDGCPNQQILISHCVTSENTEGRGSVRFDGHTEAIHLSDSLCFGVVMGGTRTFISQCIIVNSPAPDAPAGTEGVVVGYAELIGTSHELRDCQLLATANVSSSRAMVYWNDVGDWLTRAGQFTFANLYIDMTLVAGPAINLSTFSSTVRPRASLTACTVLGNGAIGSSPISIRASSSGVNVGWESVDLSGCVLDKHRSVFGAVNTLRLSGCRMSDSESNAIEIRQENNSTWGNHEVYVTDCLIFDPQKSGMLVTVNDIKAYVANNTVLNCNQDEALTLQTACTYLPVSAAGTSSFRLVGNTFGDDQTSAKQVNNYYITNVDFFEESNNTMIGGLGEVLTVSISEKRGDRYDVQNDVRDNSGDLTLAGGDWSAGTSGERNIVVGAGTGDLGMRWYGGTTSDTGWIIDDPGSAGRFKQDWQHANNRLVWTIQNTAMCIFTNDTVESFTDGATNLGTSVKRWGDIYGGDVHMARQHITGGTTIVTTDIVADANWGGDGGSFNGGTVAIISGEDSVGYFTIYAGSSPGPSANPTFTYTFKDGAPTGANPLVFVQGVGGGVQWEVLSTTATTVTVRYVGTPPNNTLIACMYHMIQTDE